MSSNPARNHARRLSAFLSLVILLVGALGMTEKAYAVEAEPTGLEIYIGGQPYSEFKISDGANEDGLYWVNEAGPLEVQNMPDGWYFYYLDTWKQDDGTNTVGVGVTNGSSRFYWCFIGASDLVQSLDYIKGIKLLDVNAGTVVEGFDPTKDFEMTVDHPAYITLENPSALLGCWTVDVNKTGYTDWTIHPKGKSSPSVHWVIKSTCQRPDSAATPEGFQIKVNGSPLSRFDPMIGGGVTNGYLDISDVTGGNGTLELGTLPKGWAFREIIPGDGNRCFFSLTNGGITYSYLIDGISKVNHTINELKGVRLNIGGSDAPFDPTQNQTVNVGDGISYKDINWSFDYSEENKEPHSVETAIPTGWVADHSAPSDSALFDLTIHPKGSNSPSVKWVIQKNSQGDNRSLSRIAGQTRYDTMSAIVDKFQPTKNGAAILASAENYPDALAASGLSEVENAPIILTAAGNLSPEAEKQLKSISPDTLYIVGGTSAISESAEKSATNTGNCENVIRFAGDTRYDTALDIVDNTYWDSDTVIIATGQNFADALSISPYAQHFNIPIILSSPESGLTGADLESINRHCFTNAIILGGTSAVPEQVEAQLEQAGISNVKRLKGDTRYETSMEIAKFETGQGMAANGSIFATGNNFPDALAAGPFAGKNNTMVLLVDEGNSATVDWVSEYKSSIEKAFIAGGPNAVNENTALSIAGKLGLSYAK